jgi:hypothetical protein
MTVRQVKPTCFPHSTKSCASSIYAALPNRGFIAKYAFPMSVSDSISSYSACATLANAAFSLAFYTPASASTTPDGATLLPRTYTLLPLPPAPLLRLPSPLHRLAFSGAALEMRFEVSCLAFSYTRLVLGGCSPLGRAAALLVRCPPHTALSTLHT